MPKSVQAAGALTMDSRRPRAAKGGGGPVAGLRAPAVARPSPTRLFLLTVASVFLGEVFVMFFLSRSGALPLPASAVLDGLFVTFLVVPVLYFFLVRPLSATIAELASIKEQLEMSREAYRTLIDSTEDSIYLVDAGGRYRFINRYHTARLGLPESAVLGRTYADLHPADKAAEFEAVIGEVVREGRSVRREHVSGRDERFFLRTFTPVTDRSGAIAAVTVVSKDVTDLKRSEQRLQELSATDELTGLKNRRGFEELAAHRLKVAERQGASVTLVYADLDDLKRINDTFGHEEGDRAIRDAALVLREACRESDVCARVGGDEFVVLLADDAGGGVDKVVERIGEGIERRNRGAGGGWTLSLSFGSAACVPGDRCPLPELMARADRRMYEAKARRKAAP